VKRERERCVVGRIPGESPKIFILPSAHDRGASDAGANDGEIAARATVIRSSR
jgi:hypothetical protein